MREISPAVGLSVDEYMDRVGYPFRPQVEEVRRLKRAGLRSLPSSSIIDQSAVLTTLHRTSLLDKIAALVDENYSGRADMCLQFADLLNRALTLLSFPSRAVVGIAIYYDAKGNEVHRWKHAWVRVGNEVIDGNVDSTHENPFVPSAISLRPYWGPVSGIPRDRRLRGTTDAALPNDDDVDDIWWPELRSWLEIDFLK
jgi:hypothetical protein